ncbi:hypothetical protein [Enterococcus sp. AZ196]|uniref:hypothetical protein n=1 Tax=Enterococcus sp. AZ196 TaxID=2774659 RepID=UPI003D296420
MAILRKTEIISIPESLMVGIEVVNGGKQNPVPVLWKKLLENNTLDTMSQNDTILDMYVGWMGDYNPQNGTFKYLAGYIMPLGYDIPKGFSYRQISTSNIGIAEIEISNSNRNVFSQLHDMTVAGIHQQGYEPDYTFGWSAEAYPFDLAFEATSGILHYICPCKKSEE